MQDKRFSLTMKLTLVVSTVILTAAVAMADVGDKILYSLNGTSDGRIATSLVFDKAGNLYGTTVQRGANNEGTVFELSSDGSGGWTE
jgi:uncharacterized repeat protein (TIGR03803 family)